MIDGEGINEGEVEGEGVNEGGIGGESGGGKVEFVRVSAITLFSPTPVRRANARKTMIR